MGVKGYKAFNADLTCQEFQYAIGKTYEMADRKRVIVRVGEGFKNYLNGKKNPEDKLCRFVVSPEREKNLQDLIEIS